MSAIIFTVGLYFSILKPTATMPFHPPAGKIQRPLVNTNSSTISIQTVASNGKTYRNEKYAFEIQYVCKQYDRACSPTGDGPNSGFAFEVDFPTSADSTYVEVELFNEASIEEWDQFLASPAGREGDGLPFQFVIRQLDDSFKLPVGKKCTLSPQCLGMRCTPNPYCQVALKGNQKMLKVIADYGAGGSVEYLIPRGPYWFDLKEFFYDEDMDFLLSPNRITSELQKKLSAADEVLNTFKFNK